MKILGICGTTSDGSAGSGKSEFTRFLVEQGFAEVGLADAMKRFCRDLYGFTHEELWGPSEKRAEPVARLGGLSARIALQRLGDWGRACYIDTWVEHVLDTAKFLLDWREEWNYDPWRGLERVYNCPPRGVVVPDVRYLNELEAIQRAGGKVLRLRRRGASSAASAGSHSSETEQLLIPDAAFDFVVENDGSLAELSERAVAVVEALGW